MGFRSLPDFLPGQSSTSFCGADTEACEIISHTLRARAVHTWKYGTLFLRPRIWQSTWLVCVRQSTEAVGRIPHIFHVKVLALMALGTSIQHTPRMATRRRWEVTLSPSGADTGSHPRCWATMSSAAGLARGHTCCLARVVSCFRGAACPHKLCWCSGSIMGSQHK